MSQYFTKLNYTLANEDTKFEYDILPYQSDHVLSVCGSGSRVLPLLAKSPKMLSLIDSSPTQLALTELRIELVKNHSYQEFLNFLGYPSQLEEDPKRRMEMFSCLSLSKESKSILKDIFQHNQWGPIIYEGKYEKTLITISKLLHKLVGNSLRKNQQIEAKEELIKVYQENFPKKRFKIFLKLISNQNLLNALLYKGNHPKKNISLTYSEYYQQLFNNLFSKITWLDSYFLYFLVFGKLDQKTLYPLEAQESIFAEMKVGAGKADISYYQGFFPDVMDQIPKNINFISLSDIPSYFSHSLGKQYLQILRPFMAKNGLICIRYFLHKSLHLKTEHYVNLNDLYQEKIATECTQIYDIDIFKFID